MQIRLARPAHSFISVFSEMSDATVIKQPSELRHPYAVVVACGPLIVLPLLALPLLHRVPPWAFMWLMAIALFLGFKWLTFATSHAPTAPVWIQLLYLASWPGLAPDEFIRPLPRSRRPSRSDWFPPSLNLVTGLLLVILVAPRTGGAASDCTSPTWSLPPSRWSMAGSPSHAETRPMGLLP